MRLYIGQLLPSHWDSYCHHIGTIDDNFIKTDVQTMDNSRKEQSIKEITIKQNAQ